jgi:hypothetical protein
MRSRNSAPVISGITTSVRISRISKPGLRAHAQGFLCAGGHHRRVSNALQRGRCHPAHEFVILHEPYTPVPAWTEGCGGSRHSFAPATVVKRPTR